MSNRSTIFLAGIFACLLSSQAHAYIDPGVGSMLVQGILAGGAGALFFVRLFWGHIKGIFATRRPLHEKYEKK